MSKQVNLDIRTAIRNSGCKMWEVADSLGLHDTNFSKILRKELSTVKKDLILRAIEKLSKEAGINDII